MLVVIPVFLQLQSF